MAKSNKTNAMRILDRYKIQYEVHEYTVVDGKTDGVSVAKSVGINPELVFKTLVTQSHGGCSPIGMTKSFKTFIHLSASHNGRIVCSGGRIEMQVDLLLEDLMKVVDSELADIVKERKVAEQ